MKHKQALIRAAKYIFMIVVVTVIIMEGKHQLSEVGLRKSLDAINQVPFWKDGIIVITALLSVSTMFFYDYFFIRSQQIDLPKRKIFGVAWVANSFNGVFGFGGLIGAGVRGMMYKEYTNNSSKLVIGIGWLAPAAVMGLSIFSFLVIIHVFPVWELLADKKWLWPVLIGIFLFFPIYVGLAAYRKNEFFTPKLTLQYSLVSVIEWFGAGLVMYLALKAVGAPISFGQAFGLYTVAAVTGVISLIPGGFGSFDLMVLSGGQLLGAESSLLLTALLMYRFAYYIIPLIFGLIIAAFEMSSTVMKKVEDKNLVAPIVEISGLVWALQRMVLRNIGNWSLPLLSLITGAFLVFIPIFDIIAYHSVQKSRLSLLSIDFYNVLLFALGITCWFFMKEMYYRTKRGLYITCITLSFAIILLVGQSENAIIGMLAAFHLLVLYLLRGQFKRHSLPFSAASIRGLLYVNLIAFLIFVFFTRSTLILLDYPKPLYGIYGIGLTSCLVACVYAIAAVFLFGRKHHVKIGEAYDEEKLDRFFAEHGGHVLSHLGYLGDKRFLFSDDGKAMVQFATAGNRMVVLGDPQGEAASFDSLLVKLQEEADYYGYRCVFYQISGDNMALYHDMGYTFFKLGEEAIVDLDTFTISGKKRAGLRSSFNRFDKKGYTFEVYNPPYSDAFWEDIKAVSDAWLGGKKEKRFSLGFFDKSYLSKAPIAVMKNSEGKITAFMTIMPVYQEDVISIDLMRHLPDEPSGEIDVMFIHLFQWAKEQGYRYFNLGMAPLSNVGNMKKAFLGERIAAAVFNNVQYLYGFKGLRDFKNKYYPKWSGKYLAYRSSYSLASAMIQVVRLIGGKKRRVFYK